MQSQMLLRAAQGLGLSVLRVMLYAGNFSFIVPCCANTPAKGMADVLCSHACSNLVARGVL